MVLSWCKMVLRWYKMVCSWYFAEGSVQGSGGRRVLAGHHVFGADKLLGELLAKAIGAGMTPTVAGQVHRSVP